MKTMMSWFADHRKSPWIFVGLLLLFALIVMVATGGKIGNANLSGAAGSNTVCDASQMDTNSEMGMVITTDGIMVRTGPNINYENVDPEHPALSYCTIFEMLGRNADSTWILISSEGLTGWIFYDVSSEKLNTEIYNLPVMNATSEHVIADNIIEGFHVTIENNMAYVTVTGLAANKAFYVRLRPDGFAKKEINFYQGVADGYGRAAFQQMLPFVWEDGSPVEYGRLVMEVFITKTKEQVGSVVILYNR